MNDDGLFNRCLKGLMGWVGRLFAIQLVLTVATPVLAGIGSTQEPGSRLAYWIVAGVLGGAILICTFFRERFKAKATAELQEQLDSARVDSAVALGQYLDTIIETIADLSCMADSEAKTRKVSQITSAICETASSLTSPPEPRCTWFRPDMNDELYADQVNHPNKPSTRRFKPRSPAHKEITRLAENAQHHYFENLALKGPPGLSADRSYQTYIGVPVIAGTEWFGWLTVDSRNAGDFIPQRDVPIMWVLARLLATTRVLAGDKQASSTVQNITMQSNQTQNATQLT